MSANPYSIYGVTLGEADKAWLQGLPELERKNIFADMYAVLERHQRGTELRRRNPKPFASDPMQSGASSLRVPLDSAAANFETRFQSGRLKSIETGTPHANRDELPSWAIEIIYLLRELRADVGELKKTHHLFSTAKRAPPSDQSIPDQHVQDSDSSSSTPTARSPANSTSRSPLPEPDERAIELLEQDLGNPLLPSDNTTNATAPTPTPALMKESSSSDQILDLPAAAGQPDSQLTTDLELIPATNKGQLPDVPERTASATTTSSSEADQATEDADNLSLISSLSEPPMEASYHYRRLTHSEAQIRLLTLFPASDRKAKIQCRLEITTLPPSNHSYEALSYTWGNQSIKHKIVVDEGSLYVSHNLYNALCYLRHDTKTRTLWVDAICINQTSAEEKNHQIKQMRDIYSSASKVLIWLGESDDDIDAAMEYLQKPREAQREDRMPMAGLTKMYNSSWWTRMWTVQELISATTDPLVICGDKYASWESVSQNLGWIGWNHMSLQKKDGFLTDPRSLVNFYLLGPGSRRTKSELTLESLLRGTKNRDASDPRDHVYSLLSLVSDHNNEIFEADYAKPVGRAYQIAMLSVFKSRKDLDWLVYASGEDGIAIPSWCVDFSSKDWENDALYNGLAVNDASDRRKGVKGEGATCGQKLVDSSNNLDEGTITLRGTRVGNIYSANMSTTGAIRRAAPMRETMSQEDLNSAQDEDIDNLLRDICILLDYGHPALKKRLGPKKAAQKLAAGDIWKVAASGKDFDDLVGRQRGVRSNEADGFAILEKVAQRLHSVRPAISYEWSHLLPEEPANFSSTAGGALFMIAYYTGTRRCYFATDTGYIGHAHRPVRVGDVLCILFGCKFPVVLRPHHGGSYKLIASTYTHDIMEGEFLRDADSVRIEEFVLL